MSGSISTANSFPLGTRLAIRTLKYPVPAPRSATRDVRSSVQNLVRLLPSVTGRVIKLLGPHLGLTEGVLIALVRVAAHVMIVSVLVLDRLTRRCLRE